MGGLLIFSVDYDLNTMSAFCFISNKSDVSTQNILSFATECFYSNNIMQYIKPEFICHNKKGKK